MDEQITVPDGVDVTMAGHTVTMESGDAAVTRTFDHPAIDISIEDDTITVSTGSGRRDDRAVLGTYTAHLHNMIEGVTNGFVYRMQGFYQHFPMDLSVQGDTFVIKNFIGERAPREIPIPDSVTVEVDGEDVVVRGADKDQVGQTAATIEQTCYKGTRDPRKFQDGVYITERGVADE